VDKLEERMVLREAGSRRLFYRAGPISVKDLDLTMAMEQGGPVYLKSEEDVKM